MAPAFPLIALTFLSLAAPSAQFTHYEEGSCQIIGDPDLYGVGVRISYYLAFLAGVVALAFGNSRAVEDAKKGNAIIGFALLIILVRNAVQGSLAVFEWDLVFTMVFLLMSVAFIPLTILGGIMSSAALSIIYGLYAVLLPWVYFNLGDQGREEDCGLKAFVLAYFDFYNVHWIGFLKAMSVIGAMGGVTLIIVGFVLAGYAIKNPKKENVADGADGGDKDALRGMAQVFAFISICVGAVTIAFTEKLISGNNVDLSEASFDSASQLIPFLVGVSTLFSALWTCVEDTMK